MRIHLACFHWSGGNWIRNCCLSESTPPLTGRPNWFDELYWFPDVIFSSSFLDLARRFWNQYYKGEKQTNKNVSKTLLLITQFEVHIVSYGPSFSPSIYGPRAKRAGPKSKGKRRGSVTYSKDRENEVSKRFIISLPCLTGSGTISIHTEHLQISEAPRKQNGSIWKRC